MATGGRARVAFGSVAKGIGVEPERGRLIGVAAGAGPPDGRRHRPAPPSVNLETAGA